jgi:hypothetical protein
MAMNQRLLLANCDQQAVMDGVEVVAKAEAIALLPATPVDD